MERRLAVASKQQQKSEAELVREALEDKLGAAAPVSARTALLKLAELGRRETINMVGKKQGHAKAYEVGQLLSKTAPFLVIDSSPAAREKALAQLPHPVCVSQLHRRRGDGGRG